MQIPTRGTVLDLRRSIHRHQTIIRIRNKPPNWNLYALISGLGAHPGGRYPGSSHPGGRPPNIDTTTLRIDNRIVLAVADRCHVAVVLARLLEPLLALFVINGGLIFQKGGFGVLE